MVIIDENTRLSQQGLHSFLEMGDIETFIFTTMEHVRLWIPVFWSLQNISLIYRIGLTL
jgi:hypothetical protein